jgi:VWFA-related protein
VHGLAVEEVALMENGVARDVVELAPDERPLTLAVLVDSSEAIGSAYRLTVVEAVLRFLAQLPSGTRFTVWTTGDRPTKIVELTDDRAAASRALKRTYPVGGSTMLDALVEAARDLRVQEGARAAVVAVSGSGIEFSSRTRDRVVDDARGAGTVFHSVQFEEGEGPQDSRQNYDYVFSSLAKQTGGLQERVLSAMGIEPALRRIATDIASQYRLRYTTLSELKDRKLELQVARHGAKARIVEGAR